MPDKFVIVIHGGAENKTREEIGPQKEAAYRQGLQDALQAGYAILQNGGSAVEAVEAAVRSMEDNPLFNAGRGGALTEDYQHEFDAAIMDGKTLHAGAVAGVQGVKNPIRLARTILEKSEHVMLGGEGAQQFAREQGLDLVDDTYFTTAEKKEDLEKQQQETSTEPFKDTVGAVALDRHGNLAAATSTGGLTGQHAGRVGDTPGIGAGTYANNQVCAVSCTGDGESILRAVAAHEVYALVKYANRRIGEACREARLMHKDRIEKDINMIALTPDGDLAMEYETTLMFRGYQTQDSGPYVAIWED